MFLKTYSARKRLVYSLAGLALMVGGASVASANHGGGGHSGGGHSGGGHHGGMGMSSGHHSGGFSSGHHHSGGGGYYGGLGGYGGYSGFGIGFGSPYGLGYSNYGSYYGSGYGYPRGVYGGLNSQGLSPQRYSYGYSQPVTSSYQTYPASNVISSSNAVSRSTVTMGANGEPQGELRPGMVLPDGAIVVSVGPSTSVSAPVSK